VGRPAKKMVNLSIEETSGVDHPAHLHEGWLVMKAASQEDVETTLSREANPSEEEMQPILKETEEVNMETQDEQTEVQEADVEKADKPSYEELQEMLNKANARIEEMEKMMGDKPKEEKEDDDLPEFLRKEAPEGVRKAFESMQKAAEDAQAQAEAAEAELRKERSDRADADAVVKARESFSNLGLDAEAVGPALRRLAETDEDLAKSVEDVLTAANAKVESADLFAEIGKSARPAGSAYEKAEAMAKAAVADGKSATYEQALSDVFTSDSDLYMSYLAEQGK
jgi:membrane protein involved in colicin uptake